MARRSLPAVLLALALLSPGCQGPATLDRPASPLAAGGLPEVRAILERAVAAERLAGAVALVSHRGEVVAREVVGLRDAEPGAPMRSDTIFRICSMTKPITSVAVMMLVEEGVLTLSDPLARYIPEFRDVQVLVPDAKSPRGWTTTPAEAPITILDLLRHTSGLTYVFLGREPLAKLYLAAGVTDGLSEFDGTTADNAQRLAALPLLHQPGTAWEYSLSTDVLGRLIEVASGRSLDVFFRERIFEPLGMKDTHFRLPPAKSERLAAAYRPAADGTIERLPRGTVELGFTRYSASYPYGSPGTYFSGGAGLVSTLDDYHRFLLMLLGGGELDGVPLLSEESVDLMTTDHCEAFPPLFKNHGDGFGLGFGVVTERGRDAGLGSIGTFSWGGFYYTYFWVDPQEELIGVFMSQLHPWGDLTVWDDLRKATYAALESAIQPAGATGG